MLKLKSDARTAAFKAVVAKLRTDGVLSVAVKKWKAIPFRSLEPTLSDLPYVIIGLTAGDIAVGSPSTHVNAMNISIRYAVDASGTNEDTAWEDVINLYGEIEKALDPFGSTAWLKDAIAKVDPTASIYGTIQITKAGYTSIPVAGVDAIQAETIVSIPLKLTACRST
jgi:hypothetical protein